jgi:uncharacterized membrane protein
MDTMKYTDLNKAVNPVVNITEKERLISAVSGGLLLALGIFGFRKSSFRRALRMTTGSLLIMRGLTGYCPVAAAKNSDAQGNEEMLKATT